MYFLNMDISSIILHYYEWLINITKTLNITLLYARGYDVSCNASERTHCNSVRKAIVHSILEVIAQHEVLQGVRVLVKFPCGC